MSKLEEQITSHYDIQRRYEKGIYFIICTS